MKILIFLLNENINFCIKMKILNLIKKLIFSFLYKHMIFPLFLLIYINSFFLNYVKHVFGSNNNDNNNDRCQKFPGNTF